MSHFVRSAKLITVLKLFPNILLLFLTVVKISWAILSDWQINLPCALEVQVQSTRTTIETQLALPRPSLMRWATTWACPMILQAAPVGHRCTTTTVSWQIGSGKDKNTHTLHNYSHIDTLRHFLCYYVSHSKVSHNSHTFRSVYPELFSGCSQEQLSDFLERANPRCLLDTPGSDRLYVGPACGNAFLDPGEECDCGTVEVSQAHKVHWH